MVGGTGIKSMTSSVPGTIGLWLGRSEDDLVCASDANAKSRSRAKVKGKMKVKIKIRSRASGPAGHYNETHGGTASK